MGRSYSFRSPFWQLIGYAVILYLPASKHIEHAVVKGGVLEGLQYYSEQVADVC